MCALQTLNFRYASRIKLIYSIDGYLALANGEVPLGMHWAARASLELAAFMNRVVQQLVRIKADSREGWQAKGEQFFRVVARARYGTSDKELTTFLRGKGFGKAMLKPFSITRCVEDLRKREGWGDAEVIYDRLSDHVHHNLSSHNASTFGMRVDTIGRSSGGGGFEMQTAAPIMRYAYPTPSTTVRATNYTAPVTLRCVRCAFDCIKELPETPYSPAELLEYTGSELGAEIKKPGQDNGFSSLDG